MRGGKDCTQLKQLVEQFLSHFLPFCSLIVTPTRGKLHKKYLINEGSFVLFGKVSWYF